MSVRVGIASGLTVIEEARTGPGTHDVATGATLALAARLQVLAEPGQVLVSDATRPLLRNAFDLQHLGQKSLKGFAGTEAVWLAREPARPRRLLAGAGDSSTTLFGREAEAADLLAAWRDCLGGTGRAFILEGEAGIGKTRLVAKLCDAVLPDGDVLALECSSYRHGAAFHPVTDWVNAVTEHSQGPELGARLSTLAGVSRETLPLLTAIMGQALEDSEQKADALERQNAIIEAVVELLSPQAGRARVLVFEDTHWADDATLEVLARLADRAREVPLLVVATTRPDVAQRDWSGGYRKVALGPLRPEATRDMITALSAPENLPETVKRTVAERSGGVPFFVEELTRAVVEARWGGDTTAVPITLQDTLMARLDRLASGKPVAQIGALLGRSFSFELLAACSDLPEARLKAGLSELVAGNLVQPAPGVGGEYVFRHALVRDVAYGSLLHSSRVSLHGRAARIYETHFPELAKAQPERVAHHYGEAGEFRPAALHWERAAELAVSQAAPDSAIDYFNRAVALLKRLPDSAARNELEVRLRTRLNMPLTMTTGFASAATEENVSRMAELCSITEPSEGALQLLWSRCMAALVRADLVTAKTTALSMRGAVERARLPNVSRMPDRILGYVAMLEGDLDAADGHFERVLAGYAPEALDPILPGHPFDVLASSVSQRAILMALRDRPQAVDKDHSRALARARALDSPATLFQVLVHLCIAHFELGDVDRLRPLLSELREVVDRNQIAPLYIELWEGWLQAHDGDLDEGLARMARARKEGTQYPLWTPKALMLRAELLAEAHRHNDALRVLDTCDADILRLRHTYLVADAMRLRASCLGALGAPEAEVTGLLGEATEIARRQGAWRFERIAQRTLQRLRPDRTGTPATDGAIR